MMNVSSPSRMDSGEGLREGERKGASLSQPVGLNPDLAPEIFRKSKMKPLSLAEEASAAEEERRAYWRVLRAFFRTAKGGGLPKGVRFTSALLAPYLEASPLHTAYPLWIPDKETYAKMPGFPADGYQTVGMLLEDAARAIAPGEDEGAVLKANLSRLERIIRLKLSVAGEAFKAGPLWEDAAQEIQKELQLKGVEALVFSGDLNKLQKQLPAGGMVVPFSQNTPLNLLAAFLEENQRDRTEKLRSQLRPILPALRDLVAIEKQKLPDAKEAGQLKQGLDFAGSFVNFDALSEVLPDAGAADLSKSRFQRLEQVLLVLEGAETSLCGKSGLMALSRTFHEKSVFKWGQQFGAATLKVVEPGEVFAAAAVLFDESMAEAAQPLKALRIAQLELENHYQPDLHDDWFGHFNWKMFSDEEMALCTPVVLFLEAEGLMGSSLQAFSQCLASNIPVKIVALPEQGNTGKGMAYRPEPAALAIAHRNAYVLQTAALDPFALLDGLREGFVGNMPAFFYLTSAGVAGDNTGDKGYLNTLAAVEGREFSGVSYHPGKGPNWGSRFSLVQNPEPESDWPTHSLEYKTGKTGTASEVVAFTYADYACAVGAFASHFHLVPPRFWHADLIPLAQFLTLSPKENASKAPFIWVADQDNHLHKAAVAWPLVEIARQRLDFWKYLQENAGIHSYHAERAVEKKAKELESDFQKRLAQVRSEQQTALAEAQTAAVEEAMDKLASALLGLDLEGLSFTGKTTERPRPAAATSAPAPEAQAEKAPAPTEPAAKPAAMANAAPAPLPAAPVKDEAMEVDAWIDTPLCTSCNECIENNGQIFQYNDDKQAFVANPRGGPYADIVKAAERCPVNIIHPGTPWEKDDPDLKELVERAKPFQ
ncbi:MAG: ferredoxin [Haliscomenobacter sp.]|nr:ferredoxin [Haliscomenobacter sp.]